MEMESRMPSTSNAKILTTAPSENQEIPNENGIPSTIDRPPPLRPEDMEALENFNISNCFVLVSTEEFESAKTDAEAELHIRQHGKNALLIAKRTKPSERSTENRMERRARIYNLDNQVVTFLAENGGRKSPSSSSGDEKGERDSDFSISESGESVMQRSTSTTPTPSTSSSSVKQFAVPRRKWYLTRSAASRNHGEPDIDRPFKRRKTVRRRNHSPLTPTSEDSQSQKDGQQKRRRPMVIIEDDEGEEREEGGAQVAKKPRSDGVGGAGTKNIRACTATVGHGASASDRENRSKGATKINIMHHQGPIYVGHKISAQKRRAIQGLRTLTKLNARTATKIEEICSRLPGMPVGMLDQIVEIGCYMNLLIDAMPANALGGVNNFIDYFKPIFRENVKNNRGAASLFEKTVIGLQTTVEIAVECVPEKTVSLVRRIRAELPDYFIDDNANKTGARVEKNNEIGGASTSESNSTAPVGEANSVAEKDRPNSSSITAAAEEELNAIAALIAESV